MFEPGTVIKTFRSKKGNTVVLRLVNKEDVAILYDYINELSLEDTFISFGGEQLSMEEEEKHVLEMVQKIEEGNAVMLLAFVGETLVGVTNVSRMVRRSKHVGSVGLTIRSKYRGEGIGKALFNALIAFSKDMQLSMLQLSVFSENKIACALYESFGFREVGRIPKKILYKGKFLDEIIMVKAL